MNERPPRSRFFPLAAFGFAVCALAGCARGEGNVSGKITYKGKPIQHGAVVFMTDDNATYSAKISGGTYRTDKKAGAGETKVAVISLEPKQAIVPKDKDKDKVPPPKLPPLDWFPIPPEYADHATTPLRFTVRANEDNVFDIDLK